MSKRLRSLVRKLRAHEPPLLPVRLYIKGHMPDRWGDCGVTRDKRGKALRFVIRLHAAPLDFMEQILLHEWAHALAWQDGKDVRDHGPEWQVTVGRLLANYLYVD